MEEQNPKQQEDNPKEDNNNSLENNQNNQNNNDSIENDNNQDNHENELKEKDVIDTNKNNNEEENNQQNSDAEDQKENNDPQTQTQIFKHKKTIEVSAIGKKRKRGEVDQEKNLEETLKFISKLRECVENDKNNIKNKKPALEKIKIIQKIHSFLTNKNHQREFLNNDGLSILQEWFKKSSDGTYLPFNSILKMLDILLELNYVEMNHLQNCQIGGYVMNLNTNDRFNKQIKQKANEVIEKFSRIIYDIKVDYNDVDSGEINYKKLFMNKKIEDSYEEEKEEEEEEQDEEQGDENEDEKNKEENNENNIDELKNQIVQDIDIDKIKMHELYKNCKIPKKDMFDFVKTPRDLGDNENKNSSPVKVNYAAFFASKKKGNNNSKTNKKKIFN